MNKDANLDESKSANLSDLNTNDKKKKLKSS